MTRTEDVAPDPNSRRFRDLADRATRAGYCLMREPMAPHDWELLDAENGELVLAAESPEQIEHWLDS